MINNTLTTDTPTEQPEEVNTNVIDFATRKAQSKEPSKFPNTPPENGTSVTISQNDPKKRKILITLKDHGDLLVEGYLGLTSSFLAIGESDGTIKFAAAEGTWQFCTDVTDNPEYNTDAETPTTSE